ncbi:MAG: chemotaxis protein CheX [Pseudomonadota bacterium]
MDEADLQVFIDGTIHYFNQSSNQPATVGTPYLVDDNKAVADEYTGIIGVSGRRKGSVYFTAPKELLGQLLRQLGETNHDHSFMCDLVGEVANTISGNARREFGKEFMISVPVVVIGDLERIANPEHLRSFVIPIRWGGSEAFLVICLE